MNDDIEFIRDLIKHVLFTNRGERLNQSDFGIGLQQYIFGPITFWLRYRVQHGKYLKIHSINNG